MRTIHLARRLLLQGVAFSLESARSRSDVTAYLRSRVASGFVKALFSGAFSGKVSGDSIRIRRGGILAETPFAPVLVGDITSRMGKTVLEGAIAVPRKAKTMLAIWSALLLGGLSASALHPEVDVTPLMCVGAVGIVVVGWVFAFLLCWLRSGDVSLLLSLVCEAMDIDDVSEYVPLVPSAGEPLSANSDVDVIEESASPPNRS